MSDKKAETTEKPLEKNDRQGLAGDGQGDS